MKKMILLFLVLSSCCTHRENGAKVLYENEKCVIIQVNDNTLVLVPGIGTDLTAGRHKRYRQESVKPITGMEIDRRRLRKNRFSEAGNDAFQRANAAFDSIYLGVSKWSNLTTFQTGGNDND
ncbi:MAG: hypothetical protein LBL33_00765 [Tannerella sp.]|jgi:hypothetical protein|nr:hypothetical protein [Tannerella sp.]